MHHNRIRALVDQQLRRSRLGPFCLEIPSKENDARSNAVEAPHERNVIAVTSDEAEDIELLMHCEVIGLEGEPDVDPHFFGLYLPGVRGVVKRGYIGPHQNIVKASLISELLRSVFRIVVPFCLLIYVADAKSATKVMRLHDLAEPLINLFENRNPVLDEAVQASKIDSGLLPWPHQNRFALKNMAVERRKSPQPDSRRTRHRQPY
jgi:hypothetical protein